MINIDRLIDMQSAGRRQVWRTAKDVQRFTLDELQRSTGLSLNTVCNGVRALLYLNMVLPVGVRETGKTGRKATVYQWAVESS